MESRVRDLRQQLFEFDKHQNLTKNDFFVSNSNFYSYSLINTWPKWEKKMLNLCGEKKSGKTHLVEIFLKTRGGLKSSANALDKDFISKIGEYQNVILEDLNNEFDEKLLYALFDYIEKQNKFLIITSQKPINLKKINLPDLKSRVKNCLVAEINAPDDNLVSALLVKYLSDYQIILDKRLVEFISKRIPRSYYEISKFICTIDQISLKKKKPINLNIIKEILGEKIE